jgi:large subunit ribosomal protein L12
MFRGKKMEYIYAAMLLHKVGKEISEENMEKVLSASGATVDKAKIKVVISALSGVNIDEAIKNASSFAVAQPSAAAPSESSEKTEKVEDNKKEEKEEEDSSAGLASLFG